MSGEEERREIRHRAAVLGDPVEHSLSPLLHNAGYRAAGLDDWEYGRMLCPRGGLADLVGGAGAEYAGFSVTMPGKFEALDFADEVTDRARAVGSANTLVRLPAGGWRADNTDVDGVHGALDELTGRNPEGPASEIRHAVLLGAGGTAHAVLFALVERGVERVDVVNRSDRHSELAGLVEGSGTEMVFRRWDEDLRALSLAADVVVSTVPASIADPYAEDLGHAPVLDVVYDPRPTKLCVAAAANGFLTAAGHVMLAHQAFGQFEQFTGVDAPREEMRAAIEAAV
ncbi:shikimate dehydrogenase [Corynebacterium frankenforstense]|uniref:shikimate dehydrogenase n=1 Tax=Corynebacterium frankenforstense TaxID=1230998 RepID=UPI000A781AB3|nr:shikimate dehydrogenase [Corynebacterium frankenforstense]